MILHPWLPETIRDGVPRQSRGGKRPSLPYRVLPPLVVQKLASLYTEDFTYHTSQNRKVTDILNCTKTKREARKSKSFFSLYFYFWELFFLSLLSINQYITRSSMYYVRLVCVPVCFHSREIYIIAHPDFVHVMGTIQCFWFSLSCL